MVLWTAGDYGAVDSCVYTREMAGWGEAGLKGEMGGIGGDGGMSCLTEGRPIIDEVTGHVVLHRGPAHYR
ncbi:hypothetical protein ACOMHN_054167 [Nucella lapillus]